MQNNTAGGLKDRLRTWFPEREFFMRSQGQVRFIKVSARLQMIGATVAVVLLAGWLTTMAAMAVSQYANTRERIALLDREAQVAKAESRVSAYRKDVDGVAGDLEKRQEFIEQMVEAHLGDLPAEARDGETVTDSRSETDKTVSKVGAAIPGAAALARIEARQLAFVESLTRFADRRAEQTAAAIRKLGLNPAAMIAANSDRKAQGGPLLRLGASGGKLDPRFKRLGLSLARMEALERGLQDIPQVLPASLEFISSGFGYRSDPFTGADAFHAGLDFRGPVGAPIYAAAQGRVTFAGVKQGYGNVIEVSHGSGLMTRYAHMSGFRAKVGQNVEAGAVIGTIGSTGRSTGPHLHFEVRIHDRAVNPRPFLEAAPHGLEEIGSARAAHVH